MKRWFALFCLPALLAATDASPLVTGAVRDQFGRPIAGARVAAAGAFTRTDAAGTFALQTRAAQVEISCDYCRPVTAAVSGDGTVAAIVQRYTAVAAQAPTQNDLRALPYGQIESVMSLEPFVVLSDSSSVLPGPRLSYYGISQFGGLLLDNGIPAYDVAAGVTQFRTVPAYDASAFANRDQRDAFRYGDGASGGTFFVQTQPAPGDAQAAALEGSQPALAFAQSTQQASFNAATSTDLTDARQRADASISFPFGTDALSATALSSSDQTVQSQQSIASSLSGARVRFDHNGAMHVFADVTADGGQYAFSSPVFPLESAWSDVFIQTGVNTTGKISTFAQAGARLSSGYYNAAAISQPRVAGNILQTNVSVGAGSQIDRVSWSAGIGAFNVSYRGGAYGKSTPNSTQILTPSVTLSYALAPQWNLEMDANQSFRLPTLAEEYGYGSDDAKIYFDRYGTQDVKLSYSDLRRLRLSLFAMNTNVTLLDSGTITAAGASLGWQIAPYVALRAWMLHVDDASRPVNPIVRFGVPPRPVTPDSVWATFENPQGLRADVIWRQDVLDSRPYSHFDASINAPLSGPVRWFVGGGSLSGNPYFSAGLRLGR